MVKSWASALAVRGIRANTLVPGPIETNSGSAGNAGSTQPKLVN